MPSILREYVTGAMFSFLNFKPCYKWNAFNTKEHGVILDDSTEVLNLVINGMPSILYNNKRSW